MGLELIHAKQAAGRRVQVLLNDPSARGEIPRQAGGRFAALHREPKLTPLAGCRPNRSKTSVMNGTCFRLDAPSPGASSKAAEGPLFGRRLGLLDVS